MAHKVAGMILAMNSKLTLWWRASLTLRERFREDRLGVTAGSLTFTTSIALVPFFTVALAIFTAFPMFAKLQLALQGWLIDSLIPDDIARQVMGYLTQFSKKANKLGIAGLTVLLITAIALVLTIDRTLNNIWRVKYHAPWPSGCSFTGPPLLWGHCCWAPVWPAALTLFWLLKAW